MEREHTAASRFHHAARAIVALAVAITVLAALFAGEDGVQASHPATIGMTSTAFTPTEVTVLVNETVHWVNSSSISHTVASDAPGFYSGLLTPGTGYTRSFSAPGIVNFYCTIHGGMTGRVIVNAGDTTGPAVTNLAVSPDPTNSAPAATLTATLTDSGATVSNIAAAEYFIGAQGPNGSGLSMAPVDGAFNATTEAVTATINVSALAVGDYLLIAHGRDTANNWGPAASVTLRVREAAIPNEVATILIIGGQLSNATAPVNFGSQTITGAEQVIETQPAAWRAADGRGTGGGWNVSLTGTDLASTGGSIGIASVKTRLAPADIVIVSGAGAPASQVLSYVALHNSTPLKLLAASAGAGMGTYDYTPGFQLTIPVEVAPGLYEASLIVSINTGP